LLELFVAYFPITEIFPVGETVWKNRFLDGLRASLCKYSSVLDSPTHDNPLGSRCLGTNMQSVHTVVNCKGCQDVRNTLTQDPTITTVPVLYILQNACDVTFEDLLTAWRQSPDLEDKSRKASPKLTNIFRQLGHSSVLCADAKPSNVMVQFEVLPKSDDDKRHATEARTPTAPSPTAPSPSREPSRPEFDDEQDLVDRGPLPLPLENPRRAIQRESYFFASAQADHQTKSPAGISQDPKKWEAVKVVDLDSTFAARFTRKPTDSEHLLQSEACAILMMVIFISHAVLAGPIGFLGAEMLLLLLDAGDKKDSTGSAHHDGPVAPAPALRGAVAALIVSQFKCTQPILLAYICNMHKNHDGKPMFLPTVTTPLPCGSSPERTTWVNDVADELRDLAVALLKFMSSELTTEGVFPSLRRCDSGFAIGNNMQPKTAQPRVSTLPKRSLEIALNRFPGECTAQIFIQKKHEVEQRETALDGEITRVVERVNTMILAVEQPEDSQNVNLHPATSTPMQQWAEKRKEDRETAVKHESSEDGVRINEVVSKLFECWVNLQPESIKDRTAGQVHTLHAMVKSRFEGMFTSDPERVLTVTSVFAKAVKANTQEMRLLWPKGDVAPIQTCLEAYLKKNLSESFRLALILQVT
jgi:hypothetical protein